MVRDLYKVFREKRPEEFEKIYRDRINSEFAEKLPFKIKPMDQPEKYQLYYLPTKAILSLTSKIYKQDRMLSELSYDIPGIARKSLILGLLVDELHSTNDLEGVKSTKEEIVRSAKAVDLNDKSKVRFDSLIMAYRKLLNDEEVEINNSEQIRKVYDEITNGEIEADEMPDGKLFRTEVTHVYKKSGSGKLIHRGVTPENKIIQFVDQLAEFMDSEEFSPLVKIAVGHYYFGYIHPFYDGNGRTSRFISSVHIRRELSVLTALSLSRGCNEYRNKYLKSFEIANSVGNRGEMNNFIETFLFLISETQQDILFQLKEKKELFHKLISKLREDDDLSDKCKVVMNILSQNYYFSAEDKGMTVQELSSAIDKSEQYTRSVLEELTKKKVVEQKMARPRIYTIDNGYFE